MGMNKVTGMLATGLAAAVLTQVGTRAAHADPIVPSAKIFAGDKACLGICTNVTLEQSGLVDYAPFNPAGSTTVTQDVGSAYVTDVRTYPMVGNAPFSFSVGGGGELADMTVAGTPSPSSSSSFSGPASHLYNTASMGNAQTQLDYSFEVLSLTGATGPVPVTIDATGAVSGTGQKGTVMDPNGLSSGPDVSLNVDAALVTSFGVSDRAHVTVSVGAKAGSTDVMLSDSSVARGAGFLSTIENDSSLAQTGGFNESGTYSVPLGMVQSVELDTLAQCSDYYGAVSCSASIDPVITVPAGYQIFFSPGFGDTAGTGGTTVPEPSCLALLSVGMLGMAALRMRARSFG